MDRENILNIKKLAEKYRIRETERDNIYLNLIEIDRIYPYLIIQNFIYSFQNRCKHDYILFYKDSKPVIYHKYVGLWWERRTKECLEYKDKYECLKCGKIIIKSRLEEPSEEFKGTGGEMINCLISDLNPSPHYVSIMDRDDEYGSSYGNTNSIPNSLRINKQIYNR